MERCISKDVMIRLKCIYNFAGICTAKKLNKKCKYMERS